MIVHQPIKRPHDPLSYRKARLPTKCTDFLAIQKDEGVVADPSAIPAAVFEFRRKAEMLRDPAYRVLDLAIFIATEIENTEFLIGPTKCKQHGVNAILHVEVGLALLAIAQNV